MIQRVLSLKEVTQELFKKLKTECTHRERKFIQVQDPSSNNLCCSIKI